MHRGGPTMDAQPIEDTATASSWPPGAAVAPRPRALVAEDDPEMRVLVAAELRRQGYDVVQASDGVELLTAIESTVWASDREPFDVVVSDINMPGLTGLDVLAALPTTLWQTPVILITAYGDEAIHAEALELGAFATIDKPFALNDLRAVLTTLPRR